MTHPTPDPADGVPADAPADAPADDPTAAVLGVLDVTADPETPDLFHARSLAQPGGRVFGGQVLAQALLAAGRTVPADRLPHSLHGYFLRPGDVRKPIALTVERLRDGRSFTARRTHALQDGQPILSMIASFQEDQPGVAYAEEMPADVPAPEDVVSALDQLEGIDHPVAKFWTQEAAFDVRHVGGSLYLGADPEPGLGRQMVWMRSRTPLPGGQLLHRALLAYACDQVMLEPVLRRTGRSWAAPGLAMASLDHAMWWHRDVRVDDWLLYVQSTPSAQGGRGLGAARVFTRDGTLVASVAQEGMVRLPG
ncbi:acyl-CoA thioesterase [Cellulomonas shaoxiangyii]|uniref:Acyl-CoA thioesterase 2 n=1 Tax=Cellulomonas shaoxiangyii TaxID=2566013 RepID=A0A4P7SIJ9_9CELL|nr:acyl-CoA thioesterase II [Cellulomonas shaoxiangyii]QCB94069.1 acyl-CoA thioesterase II [Cellulomonas shaoxiangyii]TGY78514.1 acyl-CoA thioesterase II [Cellulomonas shaoxiangyii]